MNKIICDVCKEREADLYFRFKSLSGRDKSDPAYCGARRGKVRKSLTGDGKYRDDTPEYIDLCSVCYAKIVNSVREGGTE